LARVRVHGRVWRAGRPAEGVSLAFVPAGQGPEGEESDWDFSGDDGAYEVHLPAATYRVVCDDEEGGTELRVPAGVDALTLDLHLVP